MTRQQIRFDASRLILDLYAQLMSDVELQLIEKSSEIFDALYNAVETYSWDNAKRAFYEAMMMVQEQMVEAAERGSSYDARLTRHALPGYIAMDTTVEEQSDTVYEGMVQVIDREAARISEEEIPPWNMKEGLLTGPNAQTTVTKKGKVVRYNTILFRHQTPGTTGLHGLPMPKAVFKAAKSLEPWENTASTTATWNSGFMQAGNRLLRVGGKRYSTTKKGEILTEGGAYNPETGEMRKPWKHKPKEMSKLGEHSFVSGSGGESVDRYYQHKSSIYEGMVKVTQFYEQESQQHYLTFRRVSDNSDDNSWWHNGLKRNPISEVVDERTEKDEVVLKAMIQGAEADIVELMAGVINDIG